MKSIIDCCYTRPRRWEILFREARHEEKSKVLCCIDGGTFFSALLRGFERNYDDSMHSRDSFGSFGAVIICDLKLGGRSQALVCWRMMISLGKKPRLHLFLRPAGYCIVS